MNEPRHPTSTTSTHPISSPEHNVPPLAITLASWPDDVLLTTPEAAAYLRTTDATLEVKRTVGGGPPYCKLGRSVRYRLGDLRDYVYQSARQHTTDPDGGNSPVPPRRVSGRIDNPSR